MSDFNAAVRFAGKVTFFIVGYFVVSCLIQLVWPYRNWPFEAMQSNPLWIPFFIAVPCVFLAALPGFVVRLADRLSRQK